MSGTTNSWKWVSVAAAAVLAAAVYAGTALAAAPSVTTGPTTAVGSTTATVTGTVDPGGQATTWVVEYGTSTSYGSKTASKSAGSGTAAVDVSSALTGLHAGTTYHYRLVATNGAGTSHGTDAVFTTTVPPDVTTGGASAITASSATLNGTVDPNSRATTFYFEYGTSTSYGTKTATKSAGSAASAQSVSAGISGLQAGRVYHFRIVASSDAGTTTGKDASFTTSSAPAVVTTDASSVTPTSATLRGTVTANGLSTTRWFEYGTTTGYGTKTSSTSAGSGTSASEVTASVKNLKPGTTYHYRLVAQNSSGKTFGGDKTFSTVGAPSAQTGAAQNVGPDAAALTGSLDTRGRSTTWRFDYGTSTSYGRSTSWKSAGSKSGSQKVSMTLTGLTPATTYHYRLVAKSDAGTTYAADATFSTSGVTLTVLARQVVFGGRVTLSGVVPTHQAGQQVVVFAQPFGGGSFQMRATVLTGANGTWSYLAAPAIGTVYEASWRGGMSAPVSIGVHPSIALRQTTAKTLVVKVAGGRSFAGRLVQVQRWSNGHWSTIRRARLGSRSRAQLHVVLPKGRSKIRIALSVNQAGAGFLGGVSRPITVKR
jgi:phosphodiesterase/alkaline phosphatase D-like protein